MNKYKILRIVNWLLVFSIPIMLVTTKVDTSVVNSTVDTKNLQTSLFTKILENQQSEVTPISTIDEQEKELEQDVKIEEIPIKNEVIEDNNEKEEVEDSPKEELPAPKPVIKEESDVLETYTGNLSYYYANCSDCSGYTATGLDVRNGNLYYSDATYGNVRIIAAGKEISLYSIVRIKNSSLGSNVLAIVLDRGSNIGQGRKFLIDVLTNSTESKGGVDRGISVEVLRKGR